MGLSRVLATELKDIEVNAVCPGFVDSPLTDRSVGNIVAATGQDEAEARASLAAMNPCGRLIQPGEVADAVLELVQSEGTGREVVIE
jgi:NAD(P)-dependent dehydrogenase (short-subunit alcohol dehydrogenase family)